MVGILIINKPLGYTSRDVVNLIGKKLQTRKVGHTGTLDPKASGVLVLCVGQAVKMVELMNNDDKEYIAEVILGIETDTLDMDSNATILREEKVNIPKEQIIKVVNSFKKKYLQEVPIYSSVKVDGKKLYEYARNKQDVILPQKEVEIKDISIIDDIVYKDDKISFKIKCTVSKGTYVRALIRDIGQELGVPAVMDELIRTRQGNFSIDDSYTLDDIKNDNYKMLSITEAFNTIPVLNVTDEIAFKVRNGVTLDFSIKDELTFISDKNGNLLALYKKKNDKYRPYKVFV